MSLPEQQQEGQRPPGDMPTTGPVSPVEGPPQVITRLSTLREPAMPTTILRSPRPGQREPLTGPASKEHTVVAQGSDGSVVEPPAEEPSHPTFQDVVDAKRADMEARIAERRDELERAGQASPTSAFVDKYGRPKEGPGEPRQGFWGRVRDRLADGLDRLAEQPTPWPDEFRRPDSHDFPQEPPPSWGELERQWDGEGLEVRVDDAYQNHGHGTIVEGKRNTEEEIATRRREYEQIAGLPDETSINVVLSPLPKGSVVVKFPETFRALLEQAADRMVAANHMLVHERDEYLKVAYAHERAHAESARGMRVTYGVTFTEINGGPKIVFTPFVRTSGNTTVGAYKRVIGAPDHLSDGDRAALGE